MLSKVKEITSKRVVTKVVPCDMFKMQNQPKFLSYESPRLQLGAFRGGTSYDSHCQLRTAYNRSVTHSRPFKLCDSGTLSV
jgi:hypothetical protein